MSDTPRTDAAIKQRHRDRWNGKTPAIIESSVGEDFTRQLERELAALKTQLEQMDDERLSWKMEAEQRGKALAAARSFIVRIRDTVIGWREKDHPDGFDRRTAEIIAGWVREECKMKTGQSAMEESK